MPRSGRFCPAAAIGSCVGSQCSGQQRGEAVEVCCRTEVELDPVTARRITPDGGVANEVLLDLPPSGLRDPQVDYAGRLPVSDFPPGGEQGRLVAIARSSFYNRARLEHGGDEGVP